jgi:1-deoxy-D-xylulose-5-phosphate synthase
VALVALGKTVGAAEQAAELLAQRGVEASVIDARWVKPLDEELLAEAARATGAVVTVEDHVLQGGFGSAVLEALAGRVPEARVLRLGLPDRFIEHGDVDAQWREAGIDAESIAEAAAKHAQSVRVLGGRDV